MQSMPQVVVVVLMFLAAHTAAQDRWFVEASYTGSCSALGSVSAFRAQPVGCVPFAIGTSLWNFIDCVGGNIVQKQSCNSSTCDHCAFSYNTSLTNGTDSICTAAAGLVVVQQCVSGEPSFPINAPITKSYTTTNCRGEPYSAVSSVASNACIFGAKAYCQGGKVVAELWEDDNCSTSISTRVKSGPYCQDMGGQIGGSQLYYCGALSLTVSVTVFVFVLLIALLL